MPTRLTPQNMVSELPEGVDKEAFAAKISQYLNQQLSSLVTQLWNYREFGNAKQDGAKKDVCNYLIGEIDKYKIGVHQEYGLNNINGEQLLTLLKRAEAMALKAKNTKLVFDLNVLMKQLKGTQ